MAVAEKSPLESYREQFPVTRSGVYLNHAAYGVLSTRAMDGLTRYMTTHSLHGADAVPLWKEQRQRTREKMAAFVGADPSEMAVVKNTPEAIGIVANGLDWQPGDRVIISDLEFPANAFPWLNLAGKGVETVKVRSEGGRIPTEAVIEAIDDRTRVVSLSWVEFSNGYRNDLRAIGEVCNERGVLLGADVMQGLGVLRLDVRELGIDFFAAASHKWLCGPPSTGWFYCRRDLIDRLRPVVVGQASYERGPDTSWLDYNLSLWPDSRRFETGGAPFLVLAGLEAALDLLMEVGIDRIESQVKHLTDQLDTGLTERGFKLAAPRCEEAWSGIVSFSNDRYSMEDLSQRFVQDGISVSIREGLVRVSPHFYNTEEDIERVLRVLDELV